MLKLAIVSVSLALVGCTPIYSQTGPIERPLRPDCPVRILTVPPSAPFTELGVVSGVSQSYAYSNVPGDSLRPYVCKAGGNAAIVDTCDSGVCSATIIKMAPASGEPPAGCQYDTQCKGDRLCVEGRCQDPTPR